MCYLLLATTLFLGLALSPALAQDSQSISDFIIAHHPEYLAVHPDDLGRLWSRNGWADLDLDGTGSKEYRVLYYTNEAVGALLVFRLEGGNYQKIWESGPDPVRDLSGGVGASVGLLDIDGDGRPELHLTTGTHRSEIHHMFRWDQENRQPVNLVDPRDSSVEFGAFGGSSVFFADFDNDGKLDASVYDPFYAPDRAMYMGPSGTRETLWKFDGTTFQEVGTRTVRDQDNPEAVEPGFMTMYTDIQVNPKAWRQSWLTGQGPGASVEGQKHRHVVFYLGGIEDGQYRLDQVDRSSFRVVAPQGSLLRPVRPQSVLLKAAEAEAAEGNQGVGGPRIEVIFLVGDLLEMARAPRLLPDPVGRVCFDLQSNLEGQPGLVRAWACLPVSPE